ncbi:methyltransferase domain-containing protein [Streptomyces xiamenensis]|uniref:methyltransferase domain-containing protein n=1 Tax=Streptomyces xiamenensis TaxID=408015 RepID=UPI0036ED7DEB
MSWDMAVALDVQAIGELIRLQAVMPSRIEPHGRAVDTPAGPRTLPRCIRAILAISWPEEGRLCAGEAFKSPAVRFPAGSEADRLLGEDRAWYVIGHDNDRHLYLVDLDEAAQSTNPLIHQVHRADGQPTPAGEPLSQWLTRLSWSQAHLDFGRACVRGDVARIAAALRAGAGTGPLEPSGVTPLHLAAVTHRAHAVRHLLAASADPDAATIQRDFNLHTYTAAAGDGRYLASAEAGETPLLLAVRALHYAGTPEGGDPAAVVEALLAAGADPLAFYADPADPLRTSTLEEHLTAALLSPSPATPEQLHACRRPIQQAISNSAAAVRLRTELAHSLTNPGECWRAAVYQVPRDAFAPVFYDRGHSGWIRVTSREKEWLERIYTDQVLLTKVTVKDIVTARSSSSEPGLMLEMLRALGAGPGMSTMEIGTGTGWNAALLAHRVGDDQVTTIDIDPDLTQLASARLAAAGFPGVRVVTGDGHQGDPSGAPYERIIATAQVTHIPPAWLHQAAPGAVIVAPLGHGIARLTVGPGGTAHGHFLGTEAYFMALRSDDEQPADCSTADAPAERTSVPLARITDDELEWPLSIALPGYRCQPRPAGAGSSHPALLLTTPDGSRAYAHPDGTVRQVGPRRLWDTVEAVHETFPDPPRREDFRITITGHGQRQEVWYRSPHGPTWALPVPDICPTLRQLL